METDSRAVVRFFNRRGTAEQWIKEDKQAVKMTRLSVHRFRSNEVRLWLRLIAYNLGNLWRRLALPKRIQHWSPSSLRRRLVKTGGRLVKHARYYWLLLAESHLTRRLFASMVRRIAALPDQRDRVCGLKDKQLDKKGGGNGKVSEESIESGRLRLGRHPRRRHNQLTSTASTFCCDGIRKIGSNRMAQVYYECASVAKMENPG